MTWTIRLERVGRWLTTFLVGGLILGTVGLLAMPAPGPAPVQLASFQAPQGQPRCAAMVAAALASWTPIKGSFDCLAPSFQEKVASAGFDGDQGLADNAHINRAVRATFVGATFGHAYIYELSILGGASVVLIMRLDATGLVVHISYDFPR